MTSRILQQQQLELSRLHHFKQPSTDDAASLGPDMIGFFKVVQRRQGKFASISTCWQRLVPELLNEHCALESFNRGMLTVVVDSSPHLYELKQLLLAGLQKQLLIACRQAGLRKIALKPGRWYGGNGEDRKLWFD